MKLTNLTIKDLVTPDAKLTFLVGAGCSVDPPSCLPAGRAMMDSIIKYTCAESELEKISNLPELRFEQLVEIIRDSLDENLRIIDYYGECDFPNTQHFYLADMIRKGHYVMTTNFDFLIEKALIDLGVPKKRVTPVITKEDFIKYNSPEKLLNKGNNAVYKIHGSTKNIITGENTKESLITTIQALGKNKEGLSVFQIEPFKRTLFENISKNRNLVVIGYSGSDDFDIIPTLKVLNDLKSIIWINFVKDDNEREKIYEIEQSYNIEPNKIDRVLQILRSILRMGNAEHIYRVDANTPRSLNTLLTFTPKLSLNEFSLKPKEWFKKEIELLEECMRYFVPFRIYFELDETVDALRCAKGLLKISTRLEDNYWKGCAFLSIGEVYQKQGDFPKALKNLNKSLELAEESGNMINSAKVLNSIALIYQKQGDYPNALNKYESLLKFYEIIDYSSEKATTLNNMGLIYFKQEDYSAALKSFEEALDINEQLGGLSYRAIYLSNIGNVYLKQGNYQEALEKYRESLNIEEKLGHLIGKIKRMAQIGNVYLQQEKYDEGFELCEKALISAKESQNLPLTFPILANIASGYLLQKKYDKALKNYEEALKINDQYVDPKSKAMCFKNVGSLFNQQKMFSKSLESYEKALDIFNQLGLGETPNAINIKDAMNDIKSSKHFSNQEKLLEGEADIYFNIGEQLHFQNKVMEALEWYNKALREKSTFSDQKYKARCLNNIGYIYRKQNQIDQALEFYELALQVAEQYVPEYKTNYLSNIGTIYKIKKEYSEALRYYEESLKTITESYDLDYKISILTQLIEINSHLKKNHDVITNYEELLKIHELKNDSKSKAISLINMGMVYRNQNNFTNALKRYEEGLKITEQLKEFSLKATCLSNIAMIYRKQGKFMKALEYYKSAIKLDDELGNLEEKSTDLNNMAGIFLDQKKFLEAIALYEQALQIAGNNLSVSKCLHNIGLCYNRLEKFDIAIDYIKKALFTVEELNDPKRNMNLLFDIASILEDQGRFDESIEYNEKIIKIEESIGDQQTKVNSLNNIAKIYLNQGKYEDALNRLREVLKLCEEFGYLKQKAGVLHNIGTIFYRQGKFNESMKFFEEAMQILAQLNLKESPLAQDIQHKINLIEKI